MTNILYDTPYEKYRKFGASSLTDVELLAIILRNGTKNEDVLSLANRILLLGDDDKRILGLQSLDFDDLKSIHGIGPVKAMCLGCIVELSKRMSMQQKKELLDFSNASSIAEYYMEELRHLKHESVMLLLLDGKCRLIKEIRLSSGTVNTSVFSSRDIFMYACQYNAVAFILIHNHPSGDPNPSNNDFTVTGKIKAAGELMDIPLVDHIIIGDKVFYSFRAKGYI